MLNATKVRLYPATEQRDALARQFGCARWVYNWGLEHWRKTYRETGKGMTYQSLSVALPKLKAEHEWLREADSQALQQALQRLATAFDNFFKGRARYPAFKSKQGRQSYVYPQRVKVVERRDNGWGSLYMPKIGNVRTMLHREVIGCVKNVTI